MNNIPARTQCQRRSKHSGYNPCNRKTFLRGHPSVWFQNYFFAVREVNGACLRRSSLLPLWLAVWINEPDVTGL